MPEEVRAVNNARLATVDATARSTARRLTAAVAALLLASAWVVASAAPAHADTITVVNRAQFVEAVSAPCGGATADDPRVIIVDRNFGSTYDTSVIYVSCHVRVDLNGKTVKSGTIALRDGTSMHLMSSAGGGTLQAFASSTDQNHAGIRTSQATLTIDAVRVEARGAALGAGIGGGGVSGYGSKNAESGGTIRIMGGAQVYATGGERGAGIGGGAAMAGGHGTGTSGDGGIGRGGPGPNLTISGADTYVNSVATYGAGIGGGNGIGGNSSADGGRGGVGGTVTVTDGATVYTSTYRGAGIGGGTGTGYGTTYGGRGGTLVVENATVTAISALGAAIGSGDSSEYGAHGGTLEVREGGIVTAIADGSGAGFGTGRLGANGDSDEMRLIVEEGGTLDVWSSKLSGLRIGAGLATIDGTVNVSSKTLTVDSTRFTIGVTGRLTGTEATLNGAGTIVNDGIIRMKTVTGLTVTHNNFLTRFHRAVGGSEDVRVYAPSFSAVGATMPSAASGFGWNVATDGSGEWVRPTTPIMPTLVRETDWNTNNGTSPVHVWEVEAPDQPAVVIIDAPASTRTDETFPVEAALYDPVTDTVLATNLTLAISPYGIRWSAQGWRVIVPGTWHITATITYQGHTYQESVPIDVTPGLLTYAVLAPATAIVEDGQALSFETTGYDIYGNETAIPSPELTSSSTFDAVDGLEITFHGGGTRTVELRVDGSLKSSARVQVYDDATRFEVRIHADAAVVAGTPFEVDATLVDRVTDTEVSAPFAVTLTTSNDATPFAPGMRTEQQAGPLTLFATAVYGANSYESAFELEVMPGALAALSITPASPAVHPHDGITFAVTGEDAFGNAVDATAAQVQNVTAGTPASAIRSLTFHELGDVTVRATLGSVHTDALVEVRPDPTRTVLELLDGPGSSRAGDNIPLRVAVTDSVTNEVYPFNASDVAWSSTSGSLVDNGDETGIENRAGSHVHTATIDFWGLTLHAARAWTVSAAEAAHPSPGRNDTLDGRAHTFTAAAPVTDDSPDSDAPSDGADSDSDADADAAGSDGTGSDGASSDGADGGEKSPPPDATAPWWIWIVIAGAAAALGGIIAAVARRRSRAL
jgi:hypothetical protein